MASPSIRTAQVPSRFGVVRNSEKSIYAEEYPAWNETGQSLYIVRSEALIVNDKLRAEGKTDQAIGKVKQIAGKAVDKVEQAVKKLRE